MQCATCNGEMLSLAQFSPKSYWCSACGTIRLPGDTMRPKLLPATAYEIRARLIRDGEALVDPKTGQLVEPN